MREFARSWTCWGLGKQQQQGRAKQRMLLLLMVLADCFVGVSAYALHCCSTSAQTGPAFAPFVGRGASSWTVFRMAFLVHASSTKAAEKAKTRCMSLRVQHAACRQTCKKVAHRNGQPEGLVKPHRVPWGHVEQGIHMESYSTPKKPPIPVGSSLVDVEIYGGPLTLVMRAHVHRPHSRLGRPQSHRKALLRNLATQLIRYGSIITTAAKGKELRRVIDSKIILAKKGGLHNYRQALGFFYDKKLTRSLFQQKVHRKQEIKISILMWETSSALTV